MTDERVPTIQSPGCYHRMVGDIVVSSISDGYLSGDVDVLRNIDPDDAARMLSDQFRPSRRTSVNCFLVFAAGRIALIDTGCGPYMQPTAGLLPENLATLGLGPSDIDTILLTHMHPDHVGGLSVVETGEKCFPNAEVWVHEKEFSHWHDAAAHAASKGMQTYFFGPAQNQIAPYKNDALRFFSEEEVFPGVHAVESLGHTPGHCAFLIESSGEQVLVWGDTIHVQEVQIARPDVGISFDADVRMAAESRKRLFERIASEEILAAGMHVHFPGFGRLKSFGDGFELHQEAWVHDLRGTGI